jgi:hypothetical protein
VLCLEAAHFPTCLALHTRHAKRGEWHAPRERSFKRACVSVRVAGMLPNKRQKAVGDNVEVEVEVEVEDKVDERYGKQMHEYNAEVLKRHVVHVPLRPEGV